MNYYNEWDATAAAWLQQLIDNEQIPNGYVDTRSILEIQPSDLRGFTQCHFFAGVAGWSQALKLAGWPDTRPVWTASLPCQSFSTAGKGGGTGDERHLFPDFEKLVRACNPPTIFGEQVASKLARTDWLPGVCLDLETLGYEFWAVDTCAACAGEDGEGWIVRGDQASWERIVIGAPHIRQRIYWLADADGRGELRDTRRSDEGVGSCGEPLGRGLQQTVSGGPSDGLGDSRNSGLQGHTGNGNDGNKPGRQHTEPTGPTGKASWVDCDFLTCTDGKERRVESGSFPLVDGIPRGVVPSGDPSCPEHANATAEARVMRLKGYGNAIVPPLAAMFIKNYMEVAES